MKMLKRIFLSFMICVLISASFTGCLGNEKESDKEKAPAEKVSLLSVKRGFTNSSVYVIKAEDFEEFKETATGGTFKRLGYKVPVVTEMSVGETYYIIGQTVGQTKDGSDIEFSEGRMQILGRDVYDGTSLLNTYNSFEHVSSDSFSAGDVDTEITRDTLYGVNSYDIIATANGKKAEFFVYVEIKVKEEMKLCVNYGVRGTVIHKEYGEKAVAETEANVYYNEQIELTEFKAQYLKSEDYVNGRYEESALKDSLELTVDEPSYMVVTVGVKSMLERSDGEKLTLEAHIPHISLVEETLDFAGSGSYEEDFGSSDKDMFVTFKMPEPEVGEKKFTFVYKLIPRSTTGYMSIYFYVSTDSAVSIMGKTTSLEFDFTVVDKER